jgi:hypothetical protein
MVVQLQAVGDIAAENCSLSTVHCKKMGGKGDSLAAARPWVVLKLLQSFGNS